MKTIVQHETYGTIEFEESFWTGKKNLTVNGERLNKTAKNLFQTANGETVTLTGSYLTGSKITLGGETIALTPTVKWYEILLSILPLLLVMVWGNSVALCQIVPVVGGAIGGAISALLSFLNLLIIKGVKPIFLKILISVVILGATFGICAGIGAAIVSALT